MDENKEAWRFWTSVNTQWRSSAMGRVGLDYPAIRAEAAEAGIDLSRCLWSKIQALESCELRIQSEGVSDGRKSDSQGG